MASHPDLPASLPPGDHPSPPEFPVPDGACDCHMHVFGPFSRFPLAQAENRSFTPAESSWDSYERMAACLRLSHAVIVHSAAYGSDHSCMLDALERSRGACRGIAIMDDSLTEAQLERLQRAGVVGMRLNFLENHAAPAMLQRWTPRLRELDWHAELLMNLDILQEIRPLLSRSGLRMVVDHMGYTRAQQAITHPGMKTLLALLHEGHTWVKLSGIDRIGRRAIGHEDVLPVVASLLECRPDRLVWGSDWPHVSRRVIPDDGALFNQFARWVGDSSTLGQLLSHNPRTLYEFPPLEI